MSDVSPEQEKGMIARFWAWISQSQTLQKILIALLILAFGAFVGVLFFECIETYISKLLGLSDKNEALKFLGISMGGILIALQALMSYKRAKTMEQTAEAQVDAARAQADAVAKTEQGQRQDRLKNAIEHLGHESDSVRLGGAYELFHLAEDTEDLRQTVLDILCAHIRRTTGDDDYREKHKSKPSEEIQSLLMLLFMHHSEVFKDRSIKLQGSWLNGAYLSYVCLQGADLSGVHLQGADLSYAYLKGTYLSNAHLQRADLSDAYLQGTYLSDAHLQEADLYNAQLQGAQLYNAHLQRASLFEAHLQGADLSGSHLQGAYLSDAQLQGANLSIARLQGADLFRAQLQGAQLYNAHLQGVQSQEQDYLSFSQLMEKSTGKESDLSGVILAGGLSQKDVDSLVKDLSDAQAKELRERLTPHIGQPASNQLPENSDAIIGSYTEEEAEQWIAEYEQAMSEVPEDDS